MDKLKKSGKVKSGKSMCLVNEKEKSILLQLKQNPEGLRVKSIEKLTNIPKRTAYRILKKFEKKQIIINQYPVWKPNNGQSEFWQSLSDSSEIFELHNLSYVIHLVNKPDWWNKRKPVLQRLKGWNFSNHNFGKNNSNPYQQLMNEDYVIQTYPESIIVIHRKRYYSSDPYEIIQEGMIETLNIVKFLEERFRFTFFPSGIPNISLRANDYNRMQDYMAEKCRQEGNKFLVETEIGKVWVDLSKPYGKEANTPDIQATLEKHTEDLIINKPMTNSEIQQLVAQNAQNLDNYAVHLKAHVESVKQLGKSADVNSKTNELIAEALVEMKNEFIKEIKELKEEIKNLKSSTKSPHKIS